MVPWSSEFLSALDTVYADVRDGYELAHARGQILERFVWHVLEERFPERLGACRVLRDGEPISEFTLDAATHPEPPSVGVEAKTSDFALTGPPSARVRHAAKAGWVISLIAETDQNVAAVFATWAPEHRFRAALATLVTAAMAESALIVAEEQLVQLAARLARLHRRLQRPTN